MYHTVKQSVGVSILMQTLLVDDEQSCANWTMFSRFVQIKSIVVLINISLRLQLVFLVSNIYFDCLCKMLPFQIVFTLFMLILQYQQVVRQTNCQVLQSGLLSSLQISQLLLLLQLEHCFILSPSLEACCYGALLLINCCYIAFFLIVACCYDGLFLMT